MTRPVVGLICCERDAGDERVQAVVARYVDAVVAHAAADVLLVPTVYGDMAGIVARLDGVLLTGSVSNVAPQHYGDPAAGDGPFDPPRDAAMLALVAACAAQGKPLFGICRGLQEINVACGGTLSRRVGPPGSHHAAGDADHDAAFDHGHDVALTAGGVLARALGRDQLAVNSVHFQGIARLGDGLSVEAVADDGLIEAVSGTIGGAPLLGVQWHPEWRTDDYSDRIAFFALLGAALRGRPPMEPRRP